MWQSNFPPFCNPKIWTPVDTRSRSMVRTFADHTEDITATKAKKTKSGNGQFVSDGCIVESQRVNERRSFQPKPLVSWQFFFSFLHTKELELLATSDAKLVLIGPPVTSDPAVETRVASVMFRTTHKLRTASAPVMADVWLCRGKGQLPSLTPKRWWCERVFLSSAPPAVTQAHLLTSARFHLCVPDVHCPQFLTLPFHLFLCFHLFSGSMFNRFLLHWGTEFQQCSVPLTPRFIQTLLPSRFVQTYFGSVCTHLSFISASFLMRMQVQLQYSPLVWVQYYLYVLFQRKSQVLSDFASARAVPLALVQPEIRWFRTLLSNHRSRFWTFLFWQSCAHIDNVNTKNFSNLKMTAKHHHTNKTLTLSENRKCKQDSNHLKRGLWVGKNLFFTAIDSFLSAIRQVNKQADLVDHGALALRHIAQQPTFCKFLKCFHVSLWSLSVQRTCIPIKHLLCFRQWSCLELLDFSWQALKQTLCFAFEIFLSVIMCAKRNRTVVGLLSSMREEISIWTDLADFSRRVVNMTVGIHWMTSFGRTTGSWFALSSKAAFSNCLSLWQFLRGTTFW